MEEKAFIEYNLLCIKSLKDTYQESMAFLKSELPNINLNSPKQIKKMLKETLDITTENVTISNLKNFREKYDHDSEEFDLLNGLVLYLQQKYTLTNYIDCIIKHEEGGRVYLRLEGEAWMLPNKRPLSESPEIKACVTRTHIPRQRR